MQETSRLAREQEAPNIEIDQAPPELQCCIRYFFPPEEWNNAATVSYLESGWNAFAVHDSRSSDSPCGAVIGQIGGVDISAELSIGYFQINACNYPDWDPWRFFNSAHNVGTAHALWDAAGQRWTPWYFSCKALGLC